MREAHQLAKIVADALARLLVAAGNADRRGTPALLVGFAGEGDRRLIIARLDSDRSRIDRAEHQIGRLPFPFAARVLGRQSVERRAPAIAQLERLGVALGIA